MKRVKILDSSIDGDGDDDDGGGGGGGGERISSSLFWEMQAQKAVGLRRVPTPARNKTAVGTWATNQNIERTSTATPPTSPATATTTKGEKKNKVARMLHTTSQAIKSPRMHSTMLLSFATCLNRHDFLTSVETRQRYQ